MLQKIETITSEEFLKDVESLKLRFPVARISEGTGYDKSTVSRYLNGEQPSFAFLKTFYEWVQKSGKKVENVELIQIQPALISAEKAIEMLENQVVDLKAHIKTLQNENDLLRKMSESNLAEILSNQIGMITLAKEGITRAAKYRYASEKKKLDEELHEINKIVGAVLK